MFLHFPLFFFLLTRLFILLPLPVLSLPRIPLCFSQSAHLSFSLWSSLVFLLHQHNCLFLSLQPLPFPFHVIPLFFSRFAALLSSSSSSLPFPVFLLHKHNFLLLILHPHPFLFHVIHLLFSRSAALLVPPSSPTRVSFTTNTTPSSSPFIHVIPFSLFLSFAPLF